MASKGDLFWLDQPHPLVHRIDRVEPSETPAEQECDEYTAICGATGQSWFSAAMAMPQTFVVESGDQILAGGVLCSVCFPGGTA